MKKIITTILLGTLILFTSCSSSDKVIKDDQLSSFMLGGVYFFNGYGGNEQVKSIVASDGASTKTEIVDVYKQLLEFPYKPSQKVDNIEMLSIMWDINNKNALLSQIEVLKTSAGNHKAWDWARLVNITCAGYAAGYITEEEGKMLVLEVLPLAKEKYKTWAEYYIDYNAGRMEWNAGGQEGPSDFDNLWKEIIIGENSIYNILPLN